MGKVRSDEKALLFCATLSSSEASFLKARELLQLDFGSILDESPGILWAHSDHYRNEMGEHLQRHFLFFRSLIDAGSIGEIKLKTNAIEGVLSTDGRRTVNIDPGYLTLAKVVLASTKNYSHRISLGNGIYAETELIFIGSSFRPCLFTYKDYQDEQALRMFAQMRLTFRELSD
jgi:hypothetical protein